MSTVPGWNDEPDPEPKKKTAPVPQLPGALRAEKRTLPTPKLELEPVEEETLKAKVSRLEFELAEANKAATDAWDVVRARDQEILNLQQNSDPWAR